MRLGGLPLRAVNPDGFLSRPFFAKMGRAVFLLYIDDSGDEDDPKLNHFVLGGFAIFERQIYWLSQELEKIAARFNRADSASVELHGNPMIQGNKGWKQFPQLDRINAIKDALYALNRTHVSTKVFTVVVEKNSVTTGNPIEFAFEQLCNRFDRYLGRLHLQNNTQRGLLVVDRSSFEKRFKVWLRALGQKAIVGVASGISQRCHCLRIPELLD
jgi:hypothetical protein